MASGAAAGPACRLFIRACLLAFLTLVWLGAGMAVSALSPRLALAASLQPDPPVDVLIGRAIRRLDEGSPEEALALLNRATLQAVLAGQDPTPARFAAATVYRAMGRFPEARDIYADLVREHPEVPRFRLELGAVLYAMGEDAASREAFETVHRAPETPEAVRRNVEAFFERMHARRPYSLDVELGLWHDPNPNNAPEVESFEVPWLRGPLRVTTRPDPAWVMRAGLSGAVRRTVADDTWTLSLSGRVVRDQVAAQKEAQRTWLAAGTGATRRFRRSSLSLDMGVEGRRRGGDAYSASPWAAVSLARALGAGWSAGASHRRWRTDFTAASSADAPGARTGFWLARTFRFVKLRADVGRSREWPATMPLRWSGGEASVEGALRHRDWRVSSRLALARTAFEGPQPVFFAERIDRRRAISLTLSHRRVAWRGYLPELVVEWSRTDSTLPVHARDLRRLQVRLQRVF